MLRSMTKVCAAFLVVVLGASIQAASAPGAPNALVPAGQVTSDATSTDGSDPRSWDPKKDSVAAAPGNHKVLYEDDDVRVLLVTVRPQEREPLHHHRWQSVMVVLSGGAIRDFGANGHELPTGSPPPGFKPPLVMRWLPEAEHSVLNPHKTTDFRAVRIEYKRGFPRN